MAVYHPNVVNALITQASKKADTTPDHAGLEVLSEKMKQEEVFNTPDGNKLLLNHGYLYKALQATIKHADRELHASSKYMNQIAQYLGYDTVTAFINAEFPELRKVMKMEKDQENNQEESIITSAPLQGDIMIGKNIIKANKIEGGIHLSG